MPSDITHLTNFLIKHRMEQFLKNQENILYMSTISNNDVSGEESKVISAQGFQKLIQVHHIDTYTCASDFFDKEEKKQASFAVSTDSFEGLASYDKQKTMKGRLEFLCDEKIISQSNVIGRKDTSFNFFKLEEGKLSMLVTEIKQNQKENTELPEYTDENTLSLVAEPYRFKICMLKEKAKIKSLTKKQLI